MTNITNTTRIVLAAQAGDASMGQAARDIETARLFYADLLAFEQRMEAAGEAMHNRGRWLEALVHLRGVQDSLQQFIGERITADLRARAAGE